MELLIIIGIVVLVAGACSGDKGTKDAANYQLSKNAAKLADQIFRSLFR